MNTYSQGTDTWKKVTEGMTITAYSPAFMMMTELEIVEPGQAIDLRAADRARMNRAKSGVHTPPERI
jgi:hypothetical protein